MQSASNLFKLLCEAQIPYTDAPFVIPRGPPAVRTAMLLLLGLLSISSLTSGNDRGESGEPFLLNGTSFSSRYVMSSSIDRQTTDAALGRPEVR